MKIEFKFKKIFQIIEPGNFANSIIAYARRPIMFATINKHGDAHSESIVKTWKYFLELDLYLIKINFTFIRKNKAYENTWSSI